MPSVSPRQNAPSSCSVRARQTVTFARWAFSRPARAAFEPNMRGNQLPIGLAISTGSRQRSTIAFCGARMRNVWED